VAAQVVLAELAAKVAAATVEPLHQRMELQILVVAVAALAMLS
jgi:hypothetical protein